MVDIARREIPRTAIARIKSALNLPEEKLRAFNAWANKNIEVLLDGRIETQDVGQVAAELGVHRVDFLNAASFLATTILGGDPPGTPDIERFVAELKDAGIGESSERARILLDGIHISSAQAEYARQRGLVSQSAIATLESAEALCDLRAIFRRLPGPSPSPSHARSVTEFLGFEPIIIVSLQLSDAVGNDSPCTFQVIDSGLKNLIKTLSEALQQLEVIREKHRSMLGQPE